MANLEMLLCVVGAVLFARRYARPIERWLEWQMSRPNRSHYVANPDLYIEDYERDLFHWRASRP